MNAPPSFESFLLHDGEKKLIVQKDTKVPNAAHFTLNREDHTVGNLITNQLLKDPCVIFAGYRQPHPLENSVVIRVQTTPGRTPHDAFKEAVSDLLSEMSLIEERFKSAVQQHQKGDTFS
ncbi:DNA-directed RNA polymerase II subunit RPB11-like [Symsagittifera roscoffensis]|uniref:DNA-directed RNA polymerase II subunit RPB11-like n=1 Tax=Symsagittifera roscoffensis TaxID=84072 RepID=UPI00307BC23F